MSFVSAKDLEAAREQRKREVKEMRNEVLREAKESFERERKREEQKRARGEDTWIVPAVKKRLGFKGDTSSEKKKKKKKEKKQKKRKVKKEKSESEGEDDGDGEATWVEKEDSPGTVTESNRSDNEKQQLERDEWMTIPLGISDSSLSLLTDQKRRRREEDEEDREKEEETNYMDKPGQHPRELNPFWRDGGKGLPSTAEDKMGPSGDDGRPSTSGDGGHSWLLRSYKRVLEQASESGRSLEDIATERWGSLDKLYSLLRTAGIDPDDPDSAGSGGRRRRDCLFSRTRRLDDDRQSVERFDKRREMEERGRKRRRRRYEEDTSYEKRGSHRERREEGQRSEYKRRGGEIERKKREWKDRPPPPPPQPSSDEGFLKPGDLSHSSSCLPPPSSSSSSTGEGWRKKRMKKLIDNTSHPDTEPVPLTISTGEAGEEEEERGGERKEREGEKEEGEVPKDPVTETQLNSLGAKVMKAELLGNHEKVEKLKRELERLREIKKLQEKRGSSKVETKREEKMLVLTKTDRFGREKPVQMPSPWQQTHRDRPSTHNKKGKREKYFHDDDRYSLRELVEQERMMTADETHAAIARMASKFVPSADETVDDVVDSRVKYNEKKETEKARQHSVLENRKMADAIERCQMCFDNPSFNKHLLIAVGMNTYLCAPWHTSLTEGHCYIVPMEHVTCSLFLDENVWSEIEVFRKGLTRMYADHDLDVVFMETFTSAKRKSHMFIDCIPIPREEGELAPMYFKKAILESDEEWAQNKKLVDTREKGVRGSLPTGLPYFFAEFGLDGGFGHVIEDTDQFPHYFGREVVGGLLDLSPRLWLKPHREDFEKQKEKVLQLSQWWLPYDWTQKLQHT